MLELHALLGHLTVDKTLTLHVPAPFNSYLASVLADAIRRVMLGGHPVPEDKVRKRYRESIDLMTEACDVADRAYIFDNSGSRHKLLVDVANLGGDLNVTLYAGRLNPWFVDTALWRSLV